MVTRGKNLAESGVYESIVFSAKKSEVEKCIFLSHRSIDKSKVDVVADYILNAGFNIYYDKLDEKLAKAVNEKNDKEITRLIQEAINKSSHALCFISDSTFNEKSWWVPYEIGSFDISDKVTKIFKFDTSDPSIPEFMRVKEVIETITQLNTTLANWSGPHLSVWSTMNNYKSFGGLTNDFYAHTLKGILKAR